MLTLRDELEQDDWLLQCKRTMNGSVFDQSSTSAWSPPHDRSAEAATRLSSTATTTKGCTQLTAIASLKPHRGASQRATLQLLAAQQPSCRQRPWTVSQLHPEPSTRASCMPNVGVTRILEGGRRGVTIRNI